MTGFPSRWGRTFAKWMPPGDSEERPVDYQLPVQSIDSTGAARLEDRIFELERVVHELELVILELLPVPFERSERMVEFDRKRRAPDGV